MEIPTVVLVVLSLSGLIGLGVLLYYVLPRSKEAFTDSQKESRKMCSQSDINNAYNLYVFGDTTKTKI